MKIIILGGFLGSGKTTVLRQLAAYLVSKATGQQTPVVILENEIGNFGVDNQILSGENFTVENMFSGCICCTSSGQLGNTVERIKEQYHPQWLIIEATGMAYPDKIRAFLAENMGVDAAIIAMVDAQRWKKLVFAMESFVVSQLNDASVVLLTKIDLLTEEESVETERDVARYSGTAPVIPLCAVKRQEETFWNEILKYVC